MATGIGGEVLWICPTLSSTNDVDDLSGNISTPSTHSGANVISETGSGGTHSISFNGTQGLDLGSATIHSGSTFSYSCWFKTTQNINTGGGAGLIGQYIIPNDRGPCLCLNNAQAHFYYQSNGGSFDTNEQTNSTSTSNDGNWHHVAAVFEGSSGTAKIYVDGSLVATGSNVPASVNQTRNLFLGDMNGGLFSGSIDDVRAFDKVLTDQEIVSLSQRRGYEPTNGIGDERLWLCPSLDDSADDISGNGNHGTYSGGMGTVSDTSEGGSRAYSFDGSDDFVDLTGANFLSGVDAVSVSAWIYLDNHSDTNIIYHESTDTSGASSRLALLVRTDGQLRFGGRIDDGNSFTVFASSAVSSVGIGSWYFVTGVCDFSSGIHRVYLNGSDVTSSSTSTTGTFDANTPAAVKIGTNGSNDFDGLIDDIRIFDRALTTTEITSLASTRGYTTGGGGGGEGEGGNLTFHPFNSTHVLD